MKKGTEGDITSGLCCTESNALSLSSHPNPAVIVRASLSPSAARRHGLWVLKSGFDLLEEVKSLRNGGKPRSAVSFILSAHPECAGPCLHPQALPLKPLPSLQVCPSPGKRCPPPPSCSPYAFLARQRAPAGFFHFWSVTLSPTKLLNPQSLRSLLFKTVQSWGAKIKTLRPTVAWEEGSR